MALWILLSRRQAKAFQLRRIHIQSQWEDKPVGLEVQFGEAWTEGKIDLGENKSLKTYQGSIVFNRTGEESDAFVQALTVAYELAWLSQ